MKELIELLWNGPYDVRTNIKILKHIFKKVKGYHIIGEINNQQNWPYAFIRLYGKQNNKYLGTIPYYIGQIERENYIHFVVATDYFRGKKEYHYEILKNYITREPVDDRFSNNGGDYYAGYQLIPLPDGKYSVCYNSALFSDFSSQCRTENGIFETLREAIKFISENGSIIRTC